jgi:hypothetical protein
MLWKFSSGNGANTRQNFLFKSFFSENNRFNPKKTVQFSGLWIGWKNGTICRSSQDCKAVRNTMLPEKNGPIPGAFKKGSKPVFMIKHDLNQ